MGEQKYMVNYKMISELIVNILRVVLIRKIMELFFTADEEEGKKIQAGFVCYYLLYTILYSIFNISVLYGICNYLGIAGLTLFYQGTWKKRIWVSLAIFTTDMACTLAVYFALSQEFVLQQQAIRTLLLLICVILIGYAAYPADSREIAFDKRQTGILLIIPVASVFILCALLLSLIHI